MTDQTIPADKIREIIEKMKDNRAGVDDSNHGRGYHQALTNYIPDLEALLPKPRTLADELREYGDSLAGVSVGDLRRQLILFADRAETLEKEHDEAQDMEGRATANLSIQMDRAERLMKELAEARVLVEKQTDEIARLNAHKLPYGWRLADDPDHGRVIVTKSTPDSEGYVCFVNPTDALSAGYERHFCDPADLTFLDTYQ